MSELFFGPIATWFTVPAVLGTLFFSLRTALMFVGGADGGADADVDFDVDVDADLDADAGDSSEAFKVLSLQSIAAFMMGFGWGGLGGLKGMGWSPVMSTAVGVASGVGMLWLLGTMLKAVYRLQSSGNISIAQTLEVEGRVYAAIPARGEGKGRVRLVIDDHERFYKAITEGDALPSRERVRVVSINEDNSVTVTRA
ncbi:MAG: NfeD family protein [Gemmatimonadetes bacterium]|nr:NfeD family protein [Gemmatimonadota bacterium]